MSPESVLPRSSGNLTAFAASIAGMLMFWLVVLPWIGRLQPVRAHVDRLHAADVNASAMFYTELECKYLINN